ncbi:hypothetical protein HDU93_001807, partial [Gonapodya sp. JEL0774]
MLKNAERFTRLPALNSSCVPESLLSASKSLTIANCVYHGANPYFQNPETFSAFFSRGTFTELTLDIDTDSQSLVRTDLAPEDFRLILQANPRLHTLRLYGFTLTLRPFLNDLTTFAPQLERLTVHMWGLTERRVETWLETVCRFGRRTLRRVEIFSAVYEWGLLGGPGNRL